MENIFTFIYSNIAYIIDFKLLVLLRKLHCGTMFTVWSFALFCLTQRNLFHMKDAIKNLVLFGYILPGTHIQGVFEVSFIAPR